MTDQRSRDKKSVLQSNIAELTERAQNSLEQRGICVNMLTRICSEELRESETEQVYAQLCDAIGKPSVADRMRICIALSEELCRLGRGGEIALFGDSDEVEPQTEGRIAYVRNKRNDDAFLAFAKKIKNARADYVSTFVEACEAVFDNRCEMCMLPVENNTDGKLYSFYSMLDRYDLKIGHTVSVSNDDGSENVVFALAGKRVRYAPSKARTRFEFSVIREGADFIGEIIEAVSVLGGRMSSVGTLPVQYDDRSRRCYFSVELDGSPMPLSLYLTLEYHGYNPLGIYTV